MDTNDFLTAIFGEEVGNVVYGSYKEGIRPTRYKLWGNRRTELNLKNTNYYTISVFDNDPAKPTAARRTQIFRSLHVLVLDDIGEKYDPPRGFPPPTYIMQTSVKGGIVNQQWGYKLKEPIINAKTAADFLKTVVNGSGASDKVGDIGRLVRLPGTNHKPECDSDGGSVCKLLEFDASREFTADEMLGWVDSSTDEMDFCKMPTTERGPCDDPTGHPMIEAFDEAGLLLDGETNARGWFDVDCPWKERHSGETKEETALIIRNDGSWHLHCYHSSCKPFGKDRFIVEEIVEQLETRGAKVPTERQCQSWAVGQTLAPSNDNVGGAREDLVSRYVQLRNQNNKWFDTDRKYPITTSTLDSLYAAQFRTPYISRLLSERIDCRVADGVGFMPYNPDNVDFSVFHYGGLSYANQYRPPHLKPLEGDPREWLDLVGYIYGIHTERFLDHVAFTCQFPEKKIRWQWLVYGAPRTGKSMSILPIIRIFGTHGKEVNMRNTRSRYDDMYIGAKVVAFEEVHRSRGAEEFYNDLKNTATSDNFESLEQKGTTFVTQANRYSMYLFSNHRDALPLDEGGNKFLVVKGPDRPRESAFYHKVGAFLQKQDYLAQIYGYLLRRDVSGFDSEILPVVTAEYTEMVEFSKSPEESALKDLLDDEAAPFVFYKASETRPSAQGEFEWMNRVVMIRRIEMTAFCNTGTDIKPTHIHHALPVLGFKKIYGRCEDKKGQTVYIKADYEFLKLNTAALFIKIIQFKLACGMGQGMVADDFTSVEKDYIRDNDMSVKSVQKAMKAAEVEWRKRKIKPV